MANQKTRMIVEAGLAMAISFILHHFILWQMPQGGAVKAANLVPLFFFAYRWGGKNGIWVAATYGLLRFILGFKFSVHIASIFLDYIVAYGCVGIAGFFAGSRVKAISGAVLACLCRWMASVISGAVVFAAYAPADQNPWVYSMLYNVSYMFPDMAINLVVLSLFYSQIMKRLGGRAV